MAVSEANKKLLSSHLPFFPIASPSFVSSLLPFLVRPSARHIHSTSFSPCGVQCLARSRRNDDARTSGVRRGVSKQQERKEKRRMLHAKRQRGGYRLLHMLSGPESERERKKRKKESEKERKTTERFCKKTLFDAFAFVSFCSLHAIQRTHLSFSADSGETESVGNVAVVERAREREGLEEILKCRHVHTFSTRSFSLSL